MPLAVLRRGTALGLALTLVVAASALADTVNADFDQVSTGNQSTLGLGTVAPGASIGVDVPVVVACKGTTHFAAGSTVTLDALTTSVPGDGAVTVTAGTLVFPANWPASGESCTGTESAVVVTKPHLALTAPTAEGTGYTFDVQLGVDASGATNLIFASVTLDVVAPPPPPPSDTTDPQLHGVPADITVHTTGDGALVSWAKPTATDDTDPSPTVACDPASGSLFDLGTTTVTCTATDAAGNRASATFTVTVVLDVPPPPPPPVRDLTGAWDRPLADAMPALVGRAGRTIPLKLTVFDGATAQTPTTIVAPVLRVDRLATCAADATATPTATTGRFSWSDGTWQLNLDTTGLGTGCVRLTAAVGTDSVATAVVQLVPETTVQPYKGKGKK